MVSGKRDKEQGPKLVSNPHINTIAKVIGPGLFNPSLIKSSLF